MCWKCVQNPRDDSTAQTKSENLYEHVLKNISYLAIRC